MEYNKKYSHTDPKKAHKYSKSTLPMNLQKPQFQNEKKLVSAETHNKNIYTSSNSVNKTTNNYTSSAINKKSSSTLQGNNYAASGKASEMLAQITAKYSAPYLKLDAKKDINMKPAGTTIIPDNSDLQTTLRELLKHDPSISIEPIVNITTKPLSGRILYRLLKK